MNCARFLDQAISPTLTINVENLKLQKQQPFLTPFYYDTTFHCKSNCPWQVMSCACFGPKHSPYSNYQCPAPDIATVGTNVNVFSYDAMLSRDSNLSHSRRRVDALRSHLSICNFTNLILLYFKIFDKTLCVMV